MGWFGLSDIIQMVVDAAIDDATIDEAVEEAYAMCGNEGQETIVMDGEGAFRDWAARELDGGGGGDVGSTMSGALGQEKYNATDQIWEEAASIVESGLWGVDDEGEGGDEGDGLFEVLFGGGPERKHI